MNSNMKTITLDDEAYARLKSWKRSSKDSFSVVVKRVVPQAGTLGAYLQFSEGIRTDQLAGNDVLEEAIEQRSTAKSDPWT